MTTISATTVLRTRNSDRPDKVLSTLLLRYPRWIHAEQRTHRLIPVNEELQVESRTPSLMEDPNLSRNAASSRAIPVSKLIEDIRRDPAIPLFWGANQKGMQATEECSNRVDVRNPADGKVYPLDRESAWLVAMENAIETAEAYAAAGYHKQIVNRLLEPFSHITVLVSATEWDNFLELRDHGDAEPHIAMLAREIRKCLENDMITTLGPGEWHLPFIQTSDRWDADKRAGGMSDLKKLSMARCASTSYKTVDGFDMTFERAIELHDKLVASKPIHASPAEHVAQVDKWYPEVGIKGSWRHSEEHGNFDGFRQYRHQLAA